MGSQSAANPSRPHRRDRYAGNRGPLGASDRSHDGRAPLGLDVRRDHRKSPAGIEIRYAGRSDGGCGCRRGSPSARRRGPELKLGCGRRRTPPTRHIETGQCGHRLSPRRTANRAALPAARPTDQPALRTGHAQLPVIASVQHSGWGHGAGGPYQLAAEGVASPRSRRRCGGCPFPRKARAELPCRLAWCRQSREASHLTRRRDRHDAAMPRRAVGGSQTVADQRRRRSLSSGRDGCCLLRP